LVENFEIFENIILSNKWFVYILWRVIAGSLVSNNYMIINNFISDRPWIWDIAHKELPDCNGNMWCPS